MIRVEGIRQIGRIDMKTHLTQNHKMVSEYHDRLKVEDARHGAWEDRCDAVPDATLSLTTIIAAPLRCPKLLLLRHEWVFCHRWTKGGRGGSYTRLAVWVILSHGKLRAFAWFILFVL